MAADSSSVAEPLVDEAEALATLEAFLLRLRVEAPVQEAVAGNCRSAVADRRPRLRSRPELLRREALAEVVV